jgi:hypothetical protein
MTMVPSAGGKPATTSLTGPAQGAAIGVDGVAIRELFESYRSSHGHPGAFACCSAHAAADAVPALLAEIDRVQRAYTFDTADLKRRVDEQAREIERLKADRTATLTAAIEAAQSEYLTDNTGTPEDEAYNRGVTDAIAAIGKLLAGGAR